MLIPAKWANCCCDLFPSLMEQVTYIIEVIESLFKGNSLLLDWGHKWSTLFLISSVSSGSTTWGTGGIPPIFVFRLQTLKSRKMAFFCTTW